MKKFILKYKYYLLIGLFILTFLIVVGIITKDMFFSNGGDVYGNRLDGIENYKVSDEIKTKVIEELEKNEKVNTASIRIQGKIIYVNIDYTKEVSLDNAKEIATKSLQNFTDDIKKFYDIQYLLTQKEDEESEVFPTMGSKNVTATTIVWINS